MEITRVCFSCRAEKPLDSFYDSTDRVKQRECKECTRKRRSLWWKSDEGRKSSAKSKLKARFGITWEEYEALLETANDQCEICGAAFSDVNETIKHRLGIDHDHKTGNIRGILCKDCNLALGNFKDDIGLLEKAIIYLKSKGGK